MIPRSEVTSQSRSYLQNLFPDGNVEVLGFGFRRLEIYVLLDTDTYVVVKDSAPTGYRYQPDRNRAS